MSRPQTTEIAPSRRHEHASFPVRKIEFDFSRIPKYLYADNALSSYVWLVLEAKFPAGEQFFIDSVRDLRDAVADPQLQNDISAFIGQEAMHVRAHRAANAALSRVHGIDVQRTERRTRTLMTLFNRLHTPRQRPAATVGAEHLTASLARFLLRHPEFMAGFKNENIRHLVMWHALEEREHRAVAFAVHQQAGGGYATRIFMYLWFIGALAPFVVLDILRLMISDGSVRDWPEIRRGLKTIFGRHGILGGSSRALRDYFRRDFHPFDDDQSQLEAAWRPELGVVPA